MKINEHLFINYRLVIVYINQSLVHISNQCFFQNYLTDKRLSTHVIGVWGCIVYESSWDLKTENIQGEVLDYTLYEAELQKVNLIEFSYFYLWSLKTR